VRYGGFGSTQVPTSAAIEFPARALARQPGWSRVATEFVEKTLTTMAHGGIRDHVGPAASTATRSMAVDRSPLREDVVTTIPSCLRAYLSATRLSDSAVQGSRTGIVALGARSQADKEPGGAHLATSRDAEPDVW